MLFTESSTKNVGLIINRFSTVYEVKALELGQPLKILYFAFRLFKSWKSKLLYEEL